MSAGHPSEPLREIAQELLALDLEHDGATCDWTDLRDILVRLRAALAIPKAKPEPQGTQAEPVAWIDPRELKALKASGGQYVEDITLYGPPAGPPEGEGYVPLYLAPQGTSGHPVGERCPTCHALLDVCQRYGCVDSGTSCAEDCPTDEQIIEAWDAWPKTSITSRQGAVDFVRAALKGQP